MIKFNNLKRVYSWLPALNISFVLFLSLLFAVNIFEISYGQSNTFEESETAITSYLDALIKAPLLISQALVVGVSFVHSFLFILTMKKEPIFFNNYHNNENLFLHDILNNKLFVTILVVCGAIILIMSTILIIFQASFLSFDLGLDLWSTLIILLSASVGNIFAIKLITSIFIIVLSILYFYIVKNFKFKILKFEQENQQEHEQENPKKQKLKTQIYLNLCVAILVLGSINIFSNSIQSHNAAVSFFPYIAISVDWLHFMMVSIWVGGLFYISLTLSKKLFIIEKVSNHHHDQSFITYPQYLISLQFYSLTILRFSIIAVISIGIIFITGLYMGVLHLQQPSSLFNSIYGNILIVKLLIVFSMAILGGYHHFRIPRLFNQKIEKGLRNQLQNLKKFNNSLKIEYILGIGIIFISSFLTITSPPQHESHNMNMMSMNPYGDSDMQRTASVNNQNLDQSFSFVALLLSILIATLMIFFIKRSWTNLKLYNQENELKK